MNTRDEIFSGTKEIDQKLDFRASNIANDWCAGHGDNGRNWT